MTPHPLAAWFTDFRADLQAPARVLVAPALPPTGARPPVLTAGPDAAQR